MSFQPRLREYLAHFGQTAPICELHDHPDAKDLTGLRHDVDHSLDLALELAWIESELGLRATYYLLTSHPYVHSELFLEKCLQIQVLGHEVGVHNDVLSKWVEDSSDPADTLRGFVDLMREAGLEIRGSATHGAPTCYTHGYINSWFFEETRSDAGGRFNGEGLPASEDTEGVIAPRSGQLEAADRQIELWTASMEAFGLEYEAHRVPLDAYYTDSGGSWRRSPDPINNDLHKGRNQILIHPEWWSAQKRFFFLSTARSGSKWLANLLNRATNVVAHHEFTLNHHLENGELVEDKRTGQGFRDFVTSRELVARRLRDVAAWTRRIRDDYAEANVYLAHCMDDVHHVFPDAELIHLHRDGRDVVRSLLNRSWYDTPDDDRHPTMEVEGWDEMTPVEKCCWYWARTNEELDALEGRRLPLEDATQDEEFLRDYLEATGIRITLPEVFSREHRRVINENYSSDVPVFEDWSQADRDTFARICSPIQRNLGYPAPEPSGPLESSRTRVVQTTLIDHNFEDDPTRHLEEYQPIRCSFEPRKEGLHVRVLADRGGHATVHLGGGSWATPNPGQLVLADRATYYRLEVALDLSDELKGSLHVLLFDEDVQPIRHPHRRLLAAGPNNLRLSFRPTPSTWLFTWGLYFPLHVAGECVLRAAVLRAFGKAQDGTVPSTEGA